MNTPGPDGGPVHPLENRLLNALPLADYERLRPELAPVALKAGDVLFHSGAPRDYVYFPCSGLVSLLHELRDGKTGEVAVVGNDGCVGIMALLGGSSAPGRAVVQIEGRALRIRTDAMLREFHRGGPLQDLLLRFIQALMIQMSQVAVCNRHHKVEQQVCRWLLMSLDRVAANDIRITQRLIGKRLGARRTGIVEAATRLRKAGLIDYHRGRISVPDRAALADAACECYGVVTKETERLLGRISRP